MASITGAGIDTNKSIAKKWTTRSQELLREFKNDPMHPFVAGYILSGLLAIIIPVIKYRSEVNAYTSSYEYQYNQQEQQNNDGRMEYDVNNCKWWQFWCESIWMNENGEYVNQGGNNNGNNNNGGGYSYAPSWFSGWGGGEGSGDSQDGGVSNSASMKFVYGWQIILFLGLLAYGTLVFERLARGPSRALALQSLAILIFLWTNVSFLAMWMLANGSIRTEGRQIEENGGFFSQFSVLLFMTNFWYVIWGLILTIIITIKSCQTHNVEAGVSSLHSDYEAANDQVMKAPAGHGKQITGKTEILKGDDGSTIESRPNGTWYYR